MTIGFLAMAFTSMIWGTLSDRLGPLPVVLTGSVVLAASLGLASLATSLVVFQFIFGLMVGGSIAAIFAPMMACVTGWFDTHRSLAVSLVSAGMGMAPMTMSPLAAWLISHHDWRTSMQIVALVVAAIMIPVSLLVRRPPALESAPSAPSGEPAQADMTLAQALRSPQFIILLATNFFCCATHSGPIIHTVSYAISCGIPMIAAVTIYSVEGLAGMGGRIAFGLLGDRFEQPLSDGAARCVHRATAADAQRARCQVFFQSDPPPVTSAEPVPMRWEAIVSLVNRPPLVIITSAGADENSRGRKTWDSGPKTMLHPSHRVSGRASPASVRVHRKPIRSAPRLVQGRSVRRPSTR
jgi:MFS family permease